jgi:TRAP-type C4-dicarboxylate transport system permease small subunit
MAGTYMFSTLKQLVGRVSYLAHVAGSIFLAGMMFFIATDVTLRYFFNRPILGGYEITQSLMGILVALALAHTGFQGGHITVDVLTTRLPEKMQIFLSIIILICCLCLVGLITWQNTLYVKVAFDSGYRTASLNIPYYPFIIVISIGFALYWLVLFVNFLESILKVFHK